MSDSQYYAIDFKIEDHLRDLTGSILDGQVACIVDEKDGIIGYALGAANTNHIVDRLNVWLDNQEVIKLLGERK